MVRGREVVFVDPLVSDLDTILGNLRPKVEALVLNEHSPAVRQMAIALSNRERLEAVHVIAHGAPGRVNFGSGDLSVEALEAEADSFAAIGDALGPDGALLLWSCRVGEGTRGRDFVDALSRATGAPVAAATNLVGSPALGGHWKLEAQTVRAPLTDAGVAQYAGTCAAGPSGATGALVDNYIKVVWTEKSPPGTYFIVANDRGTQRVIGQFEIPAGGYAGRIFVLISAQGPFIVAGNSAAMSGENSIGVFTRSTPTGDLVYDLATTSILGAAGTTISCMSVPHKTGP